jgi:hypothetical protein
MTIYIKINGELGNQLFQMAIGYAMAKLTNQEFVMVYNDHAAWEKRHISYFSELKYIPAHELPQHIRMGYYSEINNGVNQFKFNRQLKK